MHIILLLKVDFIEQHKKFIFDNYRFHIYHSLTIYVVFNRKITLNFIFRVLAFTLSYF